MGNALTPVNAARCSFRKRTNEMRPEDQCLLAFLVENGHISPFRHVLMTFELCGPLQVARQIWRYTVGTEQKDPLSAWNEASYRYISQQFQFYVPAEDQWRGAPDNKKQGSKGLVPVEIGREARERLLMTISQSLEDYDWAIDQGIAPEQPRLFLPSNGLYTAWWLTISLQGLAHLLTERMDGHAMWETRQFATAMMTLAAPLFPESLSVLYTTGNC